MKNLECLQGRSPLQQLQCEGEWLERAWWAMEGKVAMGVAAAGDSGHGWVPKAAARVEEAWAVATVVV